MTVITTKTANTSEGLGTLLEQAVAQTRSSIMITDQLGRIEYVNAAFSEITGYSSTEVIGRNPRILQSGRISASTYRILWETITKGITWRGQMCNRRRDGRLYWAEVTISPLRDHNGNITHFVAVQEDVTEERRAIQLYTGVFHASSNAFLVLDESIKIIEWSLRAEQMFGWRAIEMLGLDFVSQFVATKEATGVREQFDQFRLHRHSSLIGTPQRLNLRRRNGEVFPAELWLTAVDLDDEIYFTGFIRDLTEIVEAEQQLHHIQKMEAIGQLTGGLAHDFKNLLAIIDGSLRLLDMMLPECQLGGREYLKNAFSAVKRGTDITNSLLAVARRRSINPVETDINTLIVELEPLIRQSVGDAIEVTVIPSATATPRVKIDPSGFSNSLINLVINARDAMPEGGQLLVYTYSLWIKGDIEMLQLSLAPGEYVVVGVDDSGLGMTPAIATRAFEPFYTTKTAKGGTGLGLSMVYGFCRQSGGLARIESTTGSGCSIQMLLPSITVNRTDDASGSWRGTEDKTNRISILLVDDDSSLLHISYDWLVRLGYEVLTASSSAKALSHLTSRDIDLLITDIAMPGTDGIELAEQALEMQPKLRLLFVTGRIDAITAPIYWQVVEGATGRYDDMCCFVNVGQESWRVMEKPFNLERLAQTVATITNLSDQNPVVD